MDPLTLEQVAVYCGGKLLQGDASRSLQNVSKDTRTLKGGELYFALRGENFDGNAFVGEAARRGAAAAVMDGESSENPPQDFGIIRVADSLVALQSLASAVRERLALRAVCVTGSNGKTSTKDMTAAVLGVRHRVCRTQGNLNNHIGLPLSILEADASHTAAVWEIGMNHPGEIAPLAALARPDVAIITSIGVAHIEFMGSREGIAREKGLLGAALPREGLLILPAADDFADLLAQMTNARVIRAGVEAGEVQARDLRPSAEGTSCVLSHGGERVEVFVPTPGEHMVRNAVLAVAAGLEFGLSLEECAEGLSQTTLTSGRVQRKNIGGILFIDDTYNANPDSMDAALRLLASLETSGRRIAVLGRMGELGSHAAEGYARVGRAAAQCAGVLLAVGPETKPMAAAARENGMTNIEELPDTTAAREWLKANAREGDTVLVKGSRAARMERVMEGLG